MRIIAESTVSEWKKSHSAAAVSLTFWLEKMKSSEWKNLADLRKTIPSADQVRVASGRQVVVFNIAGNSFRLISALHYNTGRAFALKFMTHAEYSKDRWRREL